MQPNMASMFKKGMSPKQTGLRVYTQRATLFWHYDGSVGIMLVQEVAEY